MQVSMHPYSSLIISYIQGHYYLNFLRYMFMSKLTVAESSLFFCDGKVPEMSIRSHLCKPVVSVLVGQDTSKTQSIA